MDWNNVFVALDTRIATRDELTACGATGRAIRAAVEAGLLVRVRRDRYATPAAPRRIIEATRVGGRIACISALADHGVFAFSQSVTHVHLERTTSRPRSPTSTRRPLPSKENRDLHGVKVHWQRLVDPHSATRECVGLVDALIQAARCQEPRHTVASIDNALHQGLVDEGGIAMIFAALPARLQRLRTWLDGRAESGQESVLRLILDSAAFEYKPQVFIPGVGRVDFLVEGILVLEADSRLAHDGWNAHVRDATRDINCGQLGYLTLRPLYEHTMYQPELVLAAIRGVLKSRGI